jgi:YesN/AraC family two-component response regulator
MSLKNIEKTLFKKLHILYVEDDADTREEVSFFLKMIVGKLTVAENGQEGLKSFEQNQFDMVITDIQMPVMNGLDMVKAIREIDKDVPIAVTTAFSDTDFLMRSIECGVDKYIIKPIDMMEMTTVIQKCTSYTYMVQKVQDYDNYSKFLLSQNASFMFIMRDGECEYANENLMHAIDTHSCNEIHNKTLLFIEEDKQYTKENWIQYVQDNGDKSYLVLFNGSDKRYNLTYKHFGQINKGIFLFTEYVQDCLEKIDILEIA